MLPKRQLVSWDHSETFGPLSLCGGKPVSAYLPYSALGRCNLWLTAQGEELAEALWEPPSSCTASCITAASPGAQRSAAKMLPTKTKPVLKVLTGIKLNWPQQSIILQISEFRKCSFCSEPSCVIEAIYHVASSALQ